MAPLDADHGHPVPGPQAESDTVVRPGDLLIVAGPTRAVERFSARV